MREEESNWFSRWEEQLPSPDELMPLSQTLITPDLALAFNILPNPNNHRINPSLTPPPPPHVLNPLTPTPNNNYSLSVSAQPNNSSEFDNSGELLDSGAGAGDEQARTLKRPRLVWTPQLHKRFVDAVGHLGIKNAVPKTIMQLMSVDGLTRENVASHLQKYRLYLKRMQGLSGGGGNVGLSSGDTAMDRLFASASVPPQFLHPNRPNSDQFSPFAQHHPQLQQQYHQHRQVVGSFGSPPNGQFERSCTRQAQQQPVYSSISAGYVHNLDSGNAGEGRKVLTLFPDGDN